MCLWEFVAGWVIQAAANTPFRGLSHAVMVSVGGVPTAAAAFFLVTAAAAAVPDIARLQQDDGSFAGDNWGEIDTR